MFAKLRDQQKCDGIRDPGYAGAGSRAGFGGISQKSQINTLNNSHFIFIRFNTNGTMIKLQKQIQIELQKLWKCILIDFYAYLYTLFE